MKLGLVACCACPRPPVGQEGAQGDAGLGWMDEPGDLLAAAEAADEGGALLQRLQPLPIPEPQTTAVGVIAEILALLEPAAALGV